MVSHDAIRDLVKDLVRARWVWHLTGLKRLVGSLGVELTDGVPGRQTYLFRGPSNQEQFSLNLYHTESAIAFIEVTIDAFLDTSDLSAEEYENKVDEYFEKFEATVSAVTSVAGRPAFNDGFGSDGFPADQDAQWLALWHLPGARLMVQQKNEDRDLPFRITIVVAPSAS